MPDRPTNIATIRHIASDFSISELESRTWRFAKGVKTETYWNGTLVPVDRRVSARLLWSAKYLYVRFEANQNEPLIVSDRADVKIKTHGLWDRDVCEIFVAPYTTEQQKYFEFEIAPNGEWIDLGIDLTSGTRVTDWDFRSGMESAARIEKDRVIMAIKIPWSAFGKTPKGGDVWRGNLFRCVGRDPDRGYLAWQPTMTPEPNFHVPEKFGEFQFLSEPAA